MISKAEDIKDVAIKFLQENNIAYESVNTARFVPVANPTNSEGLDYWVVPYEYMVFELEVAYIYISDQPVQAMYVLTKHGVETF